MSPPLRHAFRVGASKIDPRCDLFRTLTCLVSDPLHCSAPTNSATRTCHHGRGLETAFNEFPTKGNAFIRGTCGRDFDPADTAVQVATWADLTRHGSPGLNGYHVRHLRPSHVPLCSDSTLNGLSPVAVSKPKPVHLHSPFFCGSDFSLSSPNSITRSISRRQSRYKGGASLVASFSPLQTSPPLQQQLRHFQGERQAELGGYHLDHHHYSNNKHQHQQQKQHCYEPHTQQQQQQQVLIARFQSASQPSQPTCISSEHHPEQGSVQSRPPIPGIPSPIPPRIPPELAVAAAGLGGQASLVGASYGSLKTRVVIFDGTCFLSHAGVRYIARHDFDRLLSFCCAQSFAAEPYLVAFGLSHAHGGDRPVYVQGYHAAYDGTTALLRIALELPLPHSLLSLLFVIPRPLRDALFLAFFRNRYRWFGQSNRRILPPADIIDRFVDREELEDEERHDEEVRKHERVEGRHGLDKPPGSID